MRESINSPVIKLQRNHHKTVTQTCLDHFTVNGSWMYGRRSGSIQTMFPLRLRIEESCSSGVQGQWV